MKINRFIVYMIVTTAFIVLFAAGIAIADGSLDAASILHNVGAAKGKHTYTAYGITNVQYHGKRIQSDVKVYRAKPNMSRIEYLSWPLKGMVVVNSERQSWRVDPKLGKVFVTDRPAPADRSSKITLLLANYNVEAGDGGKIAGRPCSQLVLRTHSGLIRKRLWVDTSTFVVLKSEDFDSNRKLRSSTEYKSIAYTNSLPASLFKCPANAYRGRQQRFAAKAMGLSELSKSLGFTVTVPRYIPSGYKFDGCRLHTSPRNGRRVAFLRYTNGLDSISVFEARKNSDSPKNDCLLGRTDRFGNRYDRTHIAAIAMGDRSYLIVGDLSRRELDKIANSLR